MKRLLAAGCENIFQLGPCFRDGEHGRWHHPEFTMLEWYRAGAGHIDILADAKALLAFVAQELRGATDFTWQGKPVSFAQELWEKRTVSQAFIEHAGWDPALNSIPTASISTSSPASNPPCPRPPVVLIDYPAPLAALARRKPDDPLRAERWELYLGGVELANAYSELTDPAEQRARFEEANAARVRGAKRGAALAEPYPLDESWPTPIPRRPPPTCPPPAASPSASTASS
jgi:elongation factor P--(R)-beta-lysine ligase